VRDSEREVKVVVVVVVVDAWERRDVTGGSADRANAGQDRTASSVFNLELLRYMRRCAQQACNKHSQKLSCTNCRRILS
jgi:hypothetical protein